MDKIQLVNLMQMLARIDDDILDLFHCDTVMLNSPFRKPIPWNLTQEYSFRIPEHMNSAMDGGYFVVHHQEREVRIPPEDFFFGDDWIFLKDYLDDEYFKIVCRKSKRIFHETHIFTCLWGSSAHFSPGIKMACNILTAQGKSSCGEGIQTYRLRELKHQNTFCIAAVASIPTPGFLEVGLDILNLVQIFMANMDPRKPKENFGNDICLWSGGFVFNQVHNNMGNVPPENIIAMFDEACKSSAFNLQRFIPGL